MHSKVGPQWLRAGLAAMLFFAAMNLTLKELSSRGIHTATIYAAVFGIAWICYRLDLRRRGLEPLSVPNNPGVFLAAALCAAANGCVLVSLKLAPNPGYAMAVNSLQSIFLAVYARTRVTNDTKMSNRDLLGIILIVSGIFVIRAFGSGDLDDKINMIQEYNRQWLLWAIIGALLHAAEFQSFSAVMERLKLAKVEQYQLIAREGIWRFVTTIFLPIAFISGGADSFNLITIGLLVIGGLLSCAGNVLSFNSLAAAPNPSYPTAIFATQTVVVAIISVHLFGSALTTAGLMAMLPILVGVYLLSGRRTGSNNSR